MLDELARWTPLHDVRRYSGAGLDTGTWKFVLLQKVGLTCLAGRRCCHSPSPHRGPSPAVWRASGSHRPDPEARRGGCWQTPSRWLAKKKEKRREQQWAEENETFQNLFMLSLKVHSWKKLLSCHGDGLVVHILGLFVIIWPISITTEQRKATRYA